jgi:hypothetical protein
LRRQDIVAFRDILADAVQNVAAALEGGIIVVDDHLEGFTLFGPPRARAAVDPRASSRRGGRSDDAASRLNDLLQALSAGPLG